MANEKKTGFFLEINMLGEEFTTGIIPDGELVDVLRVLTKPSIFGNFDIIVRHT